MTKRKNPAFDSRKVLRTHCPQGHPYDSVNTGIRKTGIRTGNRYCLACSRALSRAAYHKQRLQDPDTLRHWNNARMKKRRDASPLVRERLRVKRHRWYLHNKAWSGVRTATSRYGLTLDQYHALFERADFVCEICQSDEGRLGVDHCHETGRVRGILCNSCNAAIGHFRDDSARLQAAVRYVEDRC